MKIIINSDLNNADVLKVVQERLKKVVNGLGVEIIEMDGIDFQVASINYLVDEQEVLEFNISVPVKKQKKKEHFELSEVADIISIREDIKIKVGRKKIFEYLREMGVLSLKNLPLQKLIDDGYFVTKPVVTANGFSYLQTFATAPGIEYIVERFKALSIKLGQAEEHIENKKQMETSAGRDWFEAGQTEEEY